ncbi:SH3 domain-containing protein [Roseateles sp. P5_E7]
MKAAVLALAALIGAAQAQTGPHFIHGSWVNVREAGANTARAIEQLTTNTPVDVTARQGDWCALRFGAGRTGFVSCGLLGPKPLTLADTARNAARAFWVAPSPNRLAAYGHSLTPPPALQLEALQKTVKSGDTVRFPPAAEFDAAKKRMKAGVLLDPLVEIARGAPGDPVAVLAGFRLRPAPIKPSLFRTPQSVALVSEQDADGLAAVTGSRVSLSPTGLPTGWFSRHNGPEIEGITGFWDVGGAVLSFEPPLTVYSVAANGLVGASALRALPFNVGGEGHYCGGRYLGRSLPFADAMAHGLPVEEGMDITPQRGFAALKEGSEVLVTLVVSGNKPLRQSAKVRMQSEAVNGLKMSDGKTSPPAQSELNPRAVLREIDLDGDGIADVLLIEKPLYAGEITVAVVYQLYWFLNVNGQWFSAGEWQDQDCT